MNNGSKQPHANGSDGPLRGAVSEIYSTLQGEGLFVGERQLFIRLAGCPWRCRYCDTPGSLGRDGARLLTLEEVLDEVHRHQERLEHRTISLTGGEPLVQTDFLAALLPALRRLNRRTYLETAGTHPDLLRRVVDACDVVAMDVKLPSAVGRAFWDEHAAFLAAAGSKAFVKVVLTADTTDEEWTKTIDLVARFDPPPPLVIQPATPIRDLEERLSGTAGPEKRVLPPPPHRLLALWEQARQRLRDVRLIPQMHPVWRIP